MRNVRSRMKKETHAPGTATKKHKHSEKHARDQKKEKHDNAERTPHDKNKRVIHGREGTKKKQQCETHAAEWERKGINPGSREKTKQQPRGDQSTKNGPVCK